MLTVGLIAFALFRFVGDPVTFMLGQDATPEQRIEITRALGLDQPFYVQYLRFLGNAVQGEFGLACARCSRCRGSSSIACRRRSSFRSWRRSSRSSSES